MTDELEINSFDDLKAALAEVLHNGVAPSETADYLMGRFDALCVDTNSAVLSIPAKDVREYCPDLSLEEARKVLDSTNEYLWNSGDYADISAEAWDQIRTEVENILDNRPDSRAEESCLDDLAETYGDASACHADDVSRDAEDISR